jgi:hypothetical protein
MPEAIVEVMPTGQTTGTVIWEWHLWDHLIQDFDPTKANYGNVAAHPELLDINFPPAVLGNGDWNHANGIDYDPVNDWIVFSARTQNEIWILDHSTTTAQAASHSGGRRGRGGDILYRWGNPRAYRAGTAADQQLSGQHDPRFVPPGFPGAGHVTVFNNVLQQGQSAVFEIVLPLDAAGNFVLGPGPRYGPAAPVWSYTAPGFNGPFVSSAQRLRNGNTLICSGPQQRLFEVTPAGQTVWQFTSPGSQVVFQVQYVERTLWAATSEISISRAKVDFDLVAGSRFHDQWYLLLGTASGTSPGLPVGALLLPLNPDLLTTVMVRAPNSPFFQHTFGALDALGNGRSLLRVPGGLLPPGLAGVQLDFAYLVADRATLAPLHTSNPARVTIVP